MIFTVLLSAVSVFTRPMERVSTLDPAMCRSIYDARAVELVSETVLGIDYAARPYRLTKAFCELPEVSEDGLVYVFKTVSGKGAGDVVRSLGRLADPSVVSPNAWIMRDVDTVRAPDDGTVEIRLKRRVHYFPWLMAMSATAVVGKDGVTGEGSGPYRLKSWRKNHEMVFEIKDPPPHWRGFDVVRYIVVDDVSTQWLMFLRGEIDFLGEISRDNWDSVIGPGGKLDERLVRDGVRLYSLPALDVLYVGMNMRDKTLGTNLKLRQALNAAFDYPAWEKFYNGRITEANGPVPPGVEGRLETPAPYAYDLEKARRLMVEAGYPGGRDRKTGRRLTLTLSIGRASQESREAGELMAAFYGKIGINLELHFMTWTAFVDAVSQGRVQLFRMGWVGDYPDAQNFLQLFYSANLSPGSNHSAYVNPAFDREYEAALAASDADERNRRWAKCQEIVREDCPWVFTHYNRSYSLVRPRVGNYIPSAFPYGQEVNYVSGDRQ
jgi:peptide/nickel transport system substrate-binding protein/oligopeptide transport system substrate-binding protein